LRDYAQTCMEIAGVRQIECPHFALTIKSNPEAVEVYEPDLIPAEFWKDQQPVIDKAALKAAIKSGASPAGAALVKTSRLEIK